MADTPPLPDGPALIVVGGPTDGEVFPLEQDRSLIVGSGRLANLRLGPADISSAHLKVSWEDAGLFVLDNTSFTGTWLNGEAMEQAPLQDGDTVAFADPKEKPDWPRLRMHVQPARSSSRRLLRSPSLRPRPPRPSPPVEKATAPAPLTPRPRPTARPPAGRGPVRAPARGLALPGLPPAKAAAMVGGALALVLMIFGLVRFFFGPTPTVASAQPVTAEPGQSITLVGDRFAVDAAQNVVRFGDAEAKVTSGSETTLTAVVPDAAVPGESAITVQVGRRRSKPLPFVVLKALRISGLEPEVALPGEEVTIKGSGFDGAGLSLSVEGKATPLLEAQSTSVRFRVPALASQPVRAVPLLLRTKEQVAKPFDLMIGKLPLVLTVNPRSVEPGERVTLKGKGFGAECRGKPRALRPHARARARGQPHRAHGGGSRPGHGRPCAPPDRGPRAVQRGVLARAGGGGIVGDLSPPVLRRPRRRHGPSFRRHGGGSGAPASPRRTTRLPWRSAR